jgi:hypothetical protein
MFSDFKTGQIVARLSRGDMDEITIESKQFDLKIHNQPINLPKLKSFLAEIFHNECLKEIWKHSATSFFSDEIDQIADGLDIWAYGSNAKALVNKPFLRLPHIAQPSIRTTSI